LFRYFQIFLQVLVVVRALVGIAVFFALGLLLTCAAPVAEFLFIAGGTDAALAGFTVVGWGTCIRQVIFIFF